jgi:hypothetical protein
MTQQIVKDSQGNVVSTTISDGAQSSVEISRNARGDFSWSVKVYSDNPDQLQAQLAKYIEIAKGACQ